MGNFSFWQVDLHQKLSEFTNDVFMRAMPRIIILIFRFNENINLNSILSVVSTNKRRYIQTFFYS